MVLSASNLGGAAAAASASAPGLRGWCGATRRLRLRERPWVLSRVWEVWYNAVLGPGGFEPGEVVE